MALATKETIFNYIPQRDPICLVHSIYECNDQGIKTGFIVENGHIFVSDNKLTEAGIVENLAQSAAAQAGYLSVANNVPPKVGFIANIKDLKILKFPEVGSEIITQIKIKTQVFNVTLIEAASSVNNEPIAVCEMKIFLQE
jgi:predicted hotdog family 3-hydroxylacyl-ACP dehydratase